MMPSQKKKGLQGKMHSVVDFTSPLKDIDTRFTPTMCSPKAGEESGRKQQRRGT